MSVSLLYEALLWTFSITAIRCACDRNAISFPGLKKGETRFYLNGESFVPSCDPGYTMTNANNKLICNNGLWSGRLPPCIAANCLQTPPSVLHGKIKSSSGLHMSRVDYECNEFYFMDTRSFVQCVFGQWKGSPPICKDSRCYFQDLMQNKGVVSYNKNITFSGDYLNALCRDGYSLNGMQPLCSRGVWTMNEMSPCKEDDCIVKRISKGALMEVEDRRIWRWSKFRHETKEVLKKIGINERKPHDHRVQVVCDPGYSFQGRGSNNVTVTCLLGEWIPNPICSSNDTK